MNTPSHFLITAAIRKASSKKVSTSGFLIGSVAPDLFITIMVFFGFFWFNYSEYSHQETFNLIFGQLYFENIFWILAHNFLHSPIMIAFGFVFTFLLKDKYPKTSLWFFWFFMAVSLHSLIDILTHYDDGPLLLFPFNLELRFFSPVSYWDPKHFGREFFVFELLLDIVLLCYLVLPWISKKVRNKKKKSLD